LKPIFTFLKWLIAIMAPIILLMTAIRILLTPLYVNFEYQRPGFPPDAYGFTTAERLKWAHLSLEYLLNDADETFLTSQKLTEGVPLYNEREISHMIDVKVLVKKMITAWYILFALWIILGFVFWRIKDLRGFFHALTRGGWITIGLISAILLGVLIGFDAIFTGFHRIFFTGDTWLFRYSDTLIRLFPLVFWQDAFILVGAISALGAILLIVVGGRFSRK
jgi:integral membrane protein (TIGR01906 family)